MHPDQPQARLLLDFDQRDKQVFEAGILVAILLAQLSERALGHQLAFGDDADAVGHPFGDFKNMRRHDHGAAGTDAVLQQSLDVTRRQRIEAG